MASTLFQELQIRGLFYTQLLYQSAQVKVYEAKDFSTTSPAYVIKDITYSLSFPYEKAVQEVQINWQLPHPNILTCLDHFWFYSSQSTWELVLTFEKMPKDLMQEVNYRHTNHYHWTDEELLTLFAQAISAFGYMQEQGIAHRDIKPQNILIDRLTIKITDFGTSKSGVSQYDQSLAGTPYYLSPSLRLGLINRQQKVNHNPFKSDVYSLGLTFLSMVKLATSDLMANPAILAQRTDEEVRNLTCLEKIKEMLRLMLRVEEEERVDFIELSRYFESEFGRQLFDGGNSVVSLRKNTVSDFKDPLFQEALDQVETPQNDGFRPYDDGPILCSSCGKCVKREYIYVTPSGKSKCLKCNEQDPSET